LSPRATKSVSQLTSTITPRRAPLWMYAPTAPSAAMRDAFLSAEAMPLGSFHTSDCRGGVERRQLALKGIDGGY
jgi:hypothetical protein